MSASNTIGWWKSFDNHLERIIYKIWNPIDGIGSRINFIGFSCFNCGCDMNLFEIIGRSYKCLDCREQLRMGDRLAGVGNVTVFDTPNFGPGRETINNLREVFNVNSNAIRASFNYGFQFGNNEQVIIADRASGRVINETSPAQARRDMHYMLYHNQDIRYGVSVSDIMALAMSVLSTSYIYHHITPYDPSRVILDPLGTFRHDRVEVAYNKDMDSNVRVMLHRAIGEVT